MSARKVIVRLTALEASALSSALNQAREDLSTSDDGLGTTGMDRREVNAFWRADEKLGVAIFRAERGS